MLSVDLPEGWTYEPWSTGDRYRLVTRPRVGSATIDYEDRVFRAGGTICDYGRERPIRYGGRGWRARLEAAAIAWLESL